MTESHHRNLPVPFLSQRKNTYVFKGIYEGVKGFDSEAKNDNDDHLTYKSDDEINDKINNNEIDDNDIKEVSMSNRSCNITCIAMILHYFGITSDTPIYLKRFFRKEKTGAEAAQSCSQN